MSKIERTEKFPEIARLKMLEKSEIYKPYERICNFGFYDGYVFATDFYTTENKELIELLKESVRYIMFQHTEKAEIDLVKRIEEHLNNKP